MNKFKEVAALFGLELGEGFNVRFKSGELASYGPLKFTDDGLIDCNGVEVVHLLVRMFKGNVTVEKLPWKPKMSEKYFYIDQIGCVMEEIYTDVVFDIMCFKFCNCFKTEEEAKQNIDKILSMLKE